MAPDILKTGKPVCFGGTDPKLTKMGNPWLIRFRPNDTYSGRVIASYGVETLGKKNWAIVHSTDAFGISGFKALSASLDKLGAKVALDQGYPNQSQDFTPGRARDQIVGRRHHRLLFHLHQRPRDLRAAVAAARRDDPLGRIAHDRPRRGGEARRPRALGHLRRRRLRDRFEPGGEGIRRALRRRVERAARLRLAPGPMTRSACCAPRSTRPARPSPTRSAPRSSSTKGYKGAEGEYNFDQFGDGLHGYNIVRNEKGVIVFDKHIEFTD